MLATVTNRDSRRTHRDEMGPQPRRETLDMARRSQYLVLLRRWAQERLPAGTKAATEAAEWIRDAVQHAADPEADTHRESSSLLVRLRARLLTDRAASLRVRADRTMPSSRVEQLIGRDQLGAWEDALARMQRRPRELVILRIEFGLDFAAIAAETGVTVESARAETVNALAALIDALGQRPCGRAA